MWLGMYQVESKVKHKENLQPFGRLRVPLCFETAKTPRLNGPMGFNSASKVRKEKLFSFLQSAPGDCRNELCRVAASCSHVKLKT